MTHRAAEQRMLKNEVVFRQRNRAVQKGLDDLAVLAKHEGQEALIDPVTAKLQYCCECADENCRKRIALAPQKYKEIHTNERWFIVLPNHEVSAIEKVIKKNKDYLVVQKHLRPPKYVESLEPTPVNNV